MLKATLHQLYIIVLRFDRPGRVDAGVAVETNQVQVQDLRYRSDLAPCWTARATRGQRAVTSRGQQNIRDPPSLDSSKTPSAIPPERCERRRLVTSARLKWNRCFYLELLLMTKLSIWVLVKPPEPSWRAELIYPLTDL